jgi:hypothetical protein
MIVTILIWYITTMTELNFHGTMSVYPTIRQYWHSEHDCILLLTYIICQFQNLEMVQLYYVTANYIVNIQQLAEKKLPRFL